MAAMIEQSRVLRAERAMFSGGIKCYGDTSLLSVSDNIDYFLHFQVHLVLGTIFILLQANSTLLVSQLVTSFINKTCKKQVTCSAAVINGSAPSCSYLKPNQIYGMDII